MRQVYAEHLAAHYELSHETADWRVYVAKPSPAETVSRTGADDRRAPDPSAGGG
jgi:hypothetical protein